MAYGQKNYADIQGINGKYRINQIGCFLTSFCNLLERFGMAVDPPTLNRLFIERGIYIDVDDGIRDDLGWQSVTAYNGQIVTTVKSGGVTERNSIIRIAASNSFGTHFCLVDRIENGVVYVVDSWDGQVKASGVYGPITGWAVYTNNKPQPVTPIGDKPMTPTEEANAYRIVLNRQMEHAGSGRTGYKFITDAEPEISSQRAAANKALQDVQTALANEQAKPPREVVKEVEKIVTEYVEVTKEVPVEVPVNPSWLQKAIDFINSVLGRK